MHLRFDDNVVHGRFPNLLSGFDHTIKSGIERIADQAAH